MGTILRKPFRRNSPCDRAGVSTVLAIEPHPDRAVRLREVTEPHVPDSLTLVDSLGAAFAAMDRRVPEVVLISPLMPPDEEAELIERLRALPRTLYVQTLMTPDFARPDEARSFQYLFVAGSTSSTSRLRS